MNDFELLNLSLFATQGVVHKLRLQAEVQLNKDETDPYFIQLFQGNTTVCLIIHVFCKSCEPEIVFVLIFTIPEQFHVHKSYKTRESTLLCPGNFEGNINLSHIHSAVLLHII